MAGHLLPTLALEAALVVVVLASSCLELVSIDHHSHPSVSAFDDGLLPQNRRSFPAIR